MGARFKVTTVWLQHRDEVWHPVPTPLCVFPLKATGNSYGVLVQLEKGTTSSGSVPRLYDLVQGARAESQSPQATCTRHPP
jgi:hypothetical protein